MTFHQARAISKAGLHIRRSAWTDDKWMMIWRGTWFLFAGGLKPRPVRAPDYSKDDLLATDWTTVPAALAACPIDASIGSTGGGAPTPGSPGFPDDSPPPPFFAGGSGPSGVAVSPSPPSPPTPGTGITVTFSGITVPPSIAAIWDGYDHVNRAVTLPATGGFVDFLAGWHSGDSPIDIVQWRATASRSGSNWTVALAVNEASEGLGGSGYVVGFQTLAAQPAGKPITNSITSTTWLRVYGGTATVTAG